MIMASTLMKMKLMMMMMMLMMMLTMFTTVFVGVTRLITIPVVFFVS